MKAKARPKSATPPPPPPRPTAAKTPPTPSKAGASRRPEEYISAAEWDAFFAGQGEVRGFAVGDAPAPTAAPALSREQSPAASAAGGRARTRSPRRHDYMAEAATSRRPPMIGFVT